MAPLKKKLFILLPIALLAAGALIAGYFAFSGAVDSRGCQNALYRYIERTRLEQAADSGDLKAAEMLSRIYGGGQTRDPAKAAHYGGIYHAAAIDAGNPEEEYAMSLKYLVMDQPPGIVNVECPTSPENLKAHIEWMTKSAEHGHRLAQTLLSDIYVQGRCGIPKDLSRGYLWYAVSGDNPAYLDRLAEREKIPPEEVARIKQLAADWKPKPYTEIKPLPGNIHLYGNGNTEHYNRSADQCCRDHCVVSDFFE